MSDRPEGAPKSPARRARTTWIVLVIVAALLLAAWLFVRANGLEAHARNWLDLLVRWTHIIIGIAWIGTSFYFIFLENSLNRTEDLRPELAGNLWAVHGGGFYYVEKYKVAPEELPKKLHWFKWEAYFTWITGVLMLIIVYYANAKLTMIDPNVSALSPAAAVAIGVGVLVLAWLVYDRLCRSPLIHRPALFAAIGFVLVVAVAWALTELLSGRAAYIHVGAMLGTLMAGNVFFVIIPSQKALVRAAERREPLDPELGRHAGLRSLHNNYLTLPVVFVMISNHFPMTYQHSWNWLILAGLFWASVTVRHYLNLRERGRDASYLLPIATLVILALAYVTAPSRSSANAGDAGLPPVTMTEVQSIITTRCTPCHSATPSNPGFSAPPKGVRFDSPAEITAQAQRIRANAVDSSYMPLGNITGMTDAERQTLRRWLEQGAPGE